jgi:sugar phosphate isomerase/epimerase
MEIEIGTTADYWCNIFDDELPSKLDWIKSVGVPVVGVALPFAPAELERSLARLPSVVDEVRSRELVAGSIFPDPWRWADSAVEDPDHVGGLRRLIEAAGQAGIARVLLGPTYLDLSDWPEADKKAFAEKAYAVYQEVSEAAESVNVQLCTHTSFRPGSLWSTPESLNELFEKVPSKANGVLFCFGCEPDLGRIGQDVQLWKDRIYAVHARNIRRMPEKSIMTRLDDGDIDVPAVLKALDAAGYRGPITPEHYPVFPGKGGPETATAWMVGYLRAQIDSLKRSHS